MPYPLNFIIAPQIVKRAEDHLLCATKARSYLKSQVARAKEELKATFTDKVLAIPAIHSSLPAISYSMEVHYSFDFAQEVGSPPKENTMCDRI